jgi:hypothetical protein
MTNTWRLCRHPAPPRPADPAAQPRALPRRSGGPAAGLHLGEPCGAPYSGRNPGGFLPAACMPATATAAAAAARVRPATATAMPLRCRHRACCPSPPRLSWEPTALVCWCCRARHLLSWASWVRAKGRQDRWGARQRAREQPCRPAAHTPCPWRRPGAARWAYIWPASSRGPHVSLCRSN